MTRLRTTAMFLAVVMTAAVASAQTRAARVDACVTIDEARDTFSPQERTAALLLLAKQFELAGQPVVSEGCPVFYAVSHVRLGETIVVTLSGPDGQREATALGLDDLPALYSQMVRSIVTGRPMTGFNVVDRTNVTASQTSLRRVQADSFGYGRLGYSSVRGDHGYGLSGFGFGYRAEFDSFGLDVSFLNSAFKTSDQNYNSYGSQSSNGGFAGSLLKLEALHFMNPTANASAYLGGGVSYGWTDFGNNWHGSGLQGELTAGYEFPRASTLRVFVQADVVLPFYTARSETFSPASGFVTAHRYAPSVGISAGFGWSHR
jgi:hypothetical protein